MVVYVFGQRWLYLSEMQGLIFEESITFFENGFDHECGQRLHQRTCRGLVEVSLPFLIFLVAVRDLC